MDEEESCFMENEFTGLSDGRENLGIAISGGGQRAAALTLGWVRALYELGFWQKAKYLSVNSGSSWVTVPLELSLCQDRTQSFDRLIGRTQSFEEGKLLSVDGELQRRINGAHMNQFYKCGSWRDAVAKFYFTANRDGGKEEKTYGELYNQAIIDRADWPSPFLIVNASIVNTTSPSTKGFIPFEFTMSYCGIPCDPAVTLEAYPLRNGSKQTTKLKMGYISPDKFNIVRRENTTIESKAETSAFRLSDIAAISSDAIVQTFYQVYNGGGWLRQKLLSQAKRAFSFVHKARHLYFYNDDLDGDLCSFADGGCIDATSVTALLRRQVENLIICHASDDDPLNEATRDKWQINMMSLFGIANSSNGFIRGQTVKNYNKMRQVFDSDEWQKLIQSFEDCKASGRAYVHSARLQVKENKYLGISPYEVNAVFVYSSKCGNWEHLVEKAHPQLVEKMQKKHFNLSTAADVDSSFPYVFVLRLEYSNNLVSLFASLGAYTISSEFESLKFAEANSSNFNIRNYLKNGSVHY